MPGDSKGQGRPGMLQSMVSREDGHDLEAEQQQHSSRYNICDT